MAKMPIDTASHALLRLSADNKLVRFCFVNLTTKWNINMADSVKNAWLLNKISWLGAVHCYQQWLKQV